MATVASSGIEQIGETAGLVWQTLSDEGPLSFSRLIKIVDAPRDVVLQAVGWLAREDKLTIEETPRGRRIALR